MFEDDICRCGNSANCLKKDTCYRARKVGPGIYTVSLFYKDNEECEYYIDKRNWEGSYGKSEN